MLVRELVDATDPALLLELYGHDKDQKLGHRGTFDLDIESSKERLLDQYGDSIVQHRDVYKAYVMVYLAN